MKAGRTLGRWLRRLRNSELWREVTRLRHLPNRLIREAGLEDDLEEINKGIESIRKPPADFSFIKDEIEKAQKDFTDWTSAAPEPEKEEPLPSIDPSQAENEFSEWTKTPSTAKESDEKA